MKTTFRILVLCLAAASLSAGTAGPATFVGFYSTEAALASAVPPATVPIGTEAVTGDQGLVIANGSSWQNTATGSGSVTTVSVVSANGFAGSVANASTTPAVTLTTSVTGPLKGSSSALAAATSADIYGLWSGTCSSSTYLRGDGACAAPSGSGSVTSVGLAMPGIFTVTNSPVTSTGTLTATAAGTSGGIPYFSSATALASSAALTNHAIMLGGGAGASPTVLGSLGTTSQVLVGNGSGAPSFSSVPSGAMPALTGDVTSTAGTVATTVVAVNGAAIPVSATALGTNSSGQFVAATTTSILTTSGTTFTVVSGTGACTTTGTLVGSQQAGHFLCTGTAGASTAVITLPTSPNGHGWTCWASDETSGVVWGQSADSTTSCTIKGTIATTSDEVIFGAIPY